VLDRGFVTYSNEAKMQLLGVSEDLIDTFGAVSIAVAWSMAQGALKKSGADVAVAITGVAGPDGGSEQKPVGTVVFACAKKGENPETTNAELKLFDGAKTRAEVRYQATLVALELLLP
jgi:nicotinamide-nucleotide amidase